jgi:ferric-dicitrate binding protein FerR (iron transport regulator)
MSDQPYSYKILELADKWISGSITEPEKQELFAWYARFDDQELLLAPEYEPVVQALKQEMLAVIRQRIAADTSPPSREEPGSGARITRIRRIQWGRVAAAAVLIGAVATGTIFFANHKAGVQTPATANHKAAPSQTDIQPGSNKAVLTLADGSNISLDSAHTGRLTQQGGAEVLKLADGRLKYNVLEGNSPNTVTYNVLSTPKGGQYRLVLPDGSQVWLNAASSIRYPTAFTGTDREVEITGEAYFEIARNPSMPFRVQTVNHLGDADPMTIEVLGTHFNVNAYADEDAVRTTLLEGSVKIKKGNRSGLLRPGQQAQLQPMGDIRWIPEVDVEQVTAWKNGVFEFDGEELPVIMRQIARWYDVEVVYEGKIPTEPFTGRVSRSTTLSGVLKILKLSDIEVTVHNNKVIVRS